ncbi:MAG: class I SAM-dependent DNA methyltransferase, partial [Paracoccaceae bacterium]
MMNPTEIADALEDIATAPYDAAEFPYAFAQATGNAQATVSRLRGTLNKAKLPGVLMNKKFYILPTEPGGVETGLKMARSDKKTEKHKPAILLATDGEDLSAEHLASGDTLHCKFNEFHQHFGFFLPAAGMSRYKAAEENEVDIKASGKLAKLYDALLKKNPDWKAPERRHDLNQLMTRLIFCMFAEDVGIFSDDLFSRLIFDHAGNDGVEAHVAIRQAFAAMATPKDARGNLPQWTTELPYVNGGLFAGTIECPVFDRTAYRYLQDACGLNWKLINPDIFGSMIQSVADPEKRAELGMHYTSLPNILKVLGPLFLDGLDAEIEKTWDRAKGLGRVLERLGRIRVFDPACGSGNFLVVAYRELREREMRVLRRIGELTGKAQMQMFSEIKLTSFYGIEITDFGAETAKLALFIAEYQANARFAETFGHAAPALPLRDGGNVVCRNALRVDWEEVCPPPEGDEEVYIAGNPPFLGKAQQEAHHKADKDSVFAELGVNYKAFDYVVGWFYKAGRYIERRNAQAALVATNSIAQGDAASTIWSLILAAGKEIGFAHRTFKWRNNASANAAVMCVVVGVRNASNAAKFIFDGETTTSASHINNYLLNMPDVAVNRRSFSPFGLPAMAFGNMPYDAGNLLMNREQRDALIDEDPDAEPFVRRFMGSQEVVKGIERYCLWIDDDKLKQAMRIEGIANKVNATRDARFDMEDAAGQALAARPHQFREHYAPEQSAILVPQVTSERRP